MVLIRRSGKPYSFLSSALYILSTEKVGMSHLITNHWLQCGVLVLQCGGVWPGALGHHLLLIVIHWQSLSHLLYVFPQWGDGLPYQQEDYQPGWCLLITRVRRGRGDSQGKQSEDPDPELCGQKVPGTGSPVGGGAGLREEFTVSGHQVTVAVNDFTTVVHCPAQTTALVIQQILS